MKTLVLTLLLACAPGAAGICSAQYFACADALDCSALRAAIFEYYRARGRFARIDVAWHNDWPAERLAFGLPVKR